MQIGDGLQNFAAGLGTSKDKASYSRIGFSRLTQYVTDDLYRGSWMGRKIGDTVPGDMVREWRKWKVEADQFEKISELEDELRLKEKIHQALIYSNIYGGGAVLIGDGAEDTAQPLDLERLKDKGIQYIHAFSRFELSGDDFEYDIASPYFDLPRCFRLNSSVKQDLEIHRSRFVLFTGLPVPYHARRSQQGWGDSIFDAVADTVTQAASAHANINALLFEAKNDVIQLDGLREQMIDKDQTDKLMKRWQLASLMKANNNLLLLDKEDVYSRVTTSFSGLNDLLLTFIQIVAGACDMPVTRFMGVSPGGMNSTGESDIRNYYDNVRSKQNNVLSPALKPIDLTLKAITGLAHKSAYEWTSLWQLTDKEKAENAKLKAETSKVYADLGSLPQEALAKGIEGQLIEDGTYPGLSEALSETDDVEFDVGDLDAAVQAK